MFHQGYEPQEDGTYKIEPEPFAERNTELEYMARIEEEKREKAEIMRRKIAEQQEKEERENRRNRNYYSR